ncbi:hypothetical protein [Lysinibacillus sp. Ag94]|uniref:hypothetical protein n=1 Tax=Lysinibacillus sp. Ag94 TaxID=2936682 RepID=UPI00200D7FE7|nr:hypothetical protein [Lysinibacillus sp. Ag94]UPW83556.1 hypothetical protein MY533_01370 [Lysinibacillus sp. Ag94]
MRALPSLDKPLFSTFTGLYMSGIFINDPKSLTIMSLLYDKIYLPNQLDYVIEFSQKYKFAKYDSDLNVNLKPFSSNEEDIDPLDSLTPEQRLTANQYLKAIGKFSMHYSKLFGEVFISDFFENNKVLNAKLVRQGAPGELNTYEVSMNPIIVSSDNDERTLEVLESGAIPVFGEHHIRQNMQADKYSGKFLASLLAMKSIDIVLPPIKSAHPEAILEARYNLRDYLPLFWSEMLRFTQLFKNSLSNGLSIENVMFEATDFVDCYIRPLLIEINNKMIQEKKSRFKDIVSLSENEFLNLSIGNPQVTKSDIINMGLPLNRSQLDSSSKEESGLTFLLNLSPNLSKITY